MNTPTKANRPALAIALILIAVLSMSFNDMLIKFLSGGYPLHQMVFTRSVIGIIFGLMLVKIEGGFRILRTNTPWLHLFRGLLIVVSNMTFFTALASLPLADTTAIFFIGPLLITLLSIPVLGETVGPWRLGAVVFGFVGVMIMVQPWQSTEAREAPLYIYLLPIVGAFTYALNQVMTRKLGVSTKASALAVYIQLTFIVVSALFFIIAGDGRYAEGLTNESLIFLLRPWIWPEGRDVWLFVGLGLNSALLGYTIAQAYRMADAATVAPFEYTGLPLAIFWGWVIWGDLPDTVILLGIAMILCSGLFVFVRERIKNQNLISGKRIQRRY